MLRIGDNIYFEKDNIFYNDIVSDVLTTDEGTLYAIKNHDWWVINDYEVLDESDKSVRKFLSQTKDKMISLSEVRSWLKSYARNYYEADEWSEFKDENMINDLCYDMLYND